MSKKHGKSKADRGRPTVYDPENHPRLAGWMARAGLTNEQMACELGVSERTFYGWTKKYPEFLQATKKSKEIVDNLVEDSLLSRALGREYTKRKTIIDAETKRPVRIEATNELILPDTAAMIFWLKNRKPQEWRDKQQVDMNVAGGVLVVPEPEDEDE